VCAKQPNIYLNAARIGAHGLYAIASALHFKDAENALIAQELAAQIPHKSMNDKRCANYRQLGFTANKRACIAEFIAASQAQKFTKKQSVFHILQKRLECPTR